MNKTEAVEEKKQKTEQAAPSSSLNFQKNVTSTVCEECKKPTLVTNHIEGTIVCQSCGLV